LRPEILKNSQDYIEKEFGTYLSLFTLYFMVAVVLLNIKLEKPLVMELSK
jgi:hypothetical protein